MTDTQMNETSPRQRQKRPVEVKIVSMPMRLEFIREGERLLVEADRGEEHAREAVSTSRG